MRSSQCVTTANHLGSQADNEWPEVRGARQFSAADVVGDEGSRFGVEPEAPGARTGSGVTLCAVRDHAHEDLVDKDLHSSGLGQVKPILDDRPARTATSFVGVVCPKVQPKRRGVLLRSLRSTLYDGPGSSGPMRVTARFAQRYHAISRQQDGLSAGLWL